MSTRVLGVVETKRRYPNSERRGMLNNKRETKDERTVGQKARHKGKEVRVNGRKKKGQERGVTQHGTNKKHDVREEERLCKKLDQLIAVHRLLSYPSPSFLILIQAGALHHGSHNVESLWGVDRNVVQKLGNR